MFKERAYTSHDYLKFYQMPQIFYNKGSKYFELMKNGTARELYMLLKDRNELSIKNGWIDDEGYIYFYFKQEELADILRVSEPTLRKAFKDLKKAELVHVVRQGMNLPNIIYLLQPENSTETQEELGPKKIYYPDRKNFTIRTEKNLLSGPKKFYYPDRKNFSPNNTKYNYTKRTNNIINNENEIPNDFYYDWMAE